MVWVICKAAKLPYAYAMMNAGGGLSKCVAGQGLLLAGRA